MTETRRWDPTTPSVRHLPNALADDSLPTTAILVACLASFRALFTRSNRPRRQRINDEAPKVIRQLAPKLTLLFGSSFTGTLFDIFSNYTVNDVVLEGDSSPVAQAQTVVSASNEDFCDNHNEYASGSAEHILPLNKVLVRHDIGTN